MYNFEDANALLALERTWVAEDVLCHARWCVVLYDSRKNWNVYYLLGLHNGPKELATIEVVELSVDGTDGTSSWTALSDPDRGMSSSNIGINR
jgi:hypothetical protein